MKKILLIQPWNYHDEGILSHDLAHEWRNGPYSLLCLASVLKKHCVPVSLVDLQPILIKCCGDVDETLSHLSVELDRFKPDIIGVSFFSYQYLETEKIVKFCRSTCMQIGISPLYIAGGIHASVEPHETVRQLGFDYAFVGEAELGIVEIARTGLVESVQGIVTCNGRISKGIPVYDLDDLPFPDWQLCDVDFYTTPSFAKTSLKAVRTVDILMGRGCAYRCSFCAYSTLSSVRYNSVAYLIKQITHLKQSLNIDSIYFTDSSVGNNRKLLVEFCRNIISSKLNHNFEWYANIRSNQVDEDLLLLMWESGCRFLFYGFETGSQRILDLMNKKCTVEQNIDAAMLHNKLNFPYHASFIVGYPTETEEEIVQTLDLICKLKPYRTGVNWYVPLPGSDDYDKLKKAGYIEMTDALQWRRIGEVLPTGKIYADIEPDRFKQLYAELCQQAAEMNSMHQSEPWLGPCINKENDMTENNSNTFEIDLRDKWQEIPSTRQGRAFSSELLTWPDDALLMHWEECRQQTTTPEVRGWFQDLYKDDFTGFNIADVGPGIGVDGIYFAEHGANVTFVDIVEDNLKLLERICTLKGIKAKYYFIDDFFSYRFENNFDAFFFIGSMINAPFDFTQRQIAEMMKFLRPGGKALMLAYPEERYIQSGAKSFEEFGKMTDGERTPWVEWYNDEKVIALFGPGFKLNWSRNFGQDNIEFNWFDLTKIEDMKIPASAEETVGLAVTEYGISVPMTHVFDLQSVMNFETPMEYSKTSLTKKFVDWKMEEDDAPIFRYIYRNIQPRRHLEFGTWQGHGTVLCLEESEATVWTLNRPFGEEGAYGFYQNEIPDAKIWANKIGISDVERYPSDSIGFIGRKYLDQDLGNRVCQIYCDSQDWDTINYPDGFFDTILIDGSHTKEIVISDTHKAMPLLRSGGIMMWHDFCPTEYQKFEACRGVMAGIAQEWNYINSHMTKLFWIYPSMILLGVKK